MSALEHRSTDDSSLPPSRLIPFRLFSSFLPPRSGCDLLRTFKRTMSLSGRERPSLSTRKISGNVKNGADGQRARNTSRLVSSSLVSSRHVLLESRRLSCVIITFTTRTGCCRVRPLAILRTARRGETPPRRTRIREGLS